MICETVENARIEANAPSQVACNKYVLSTNFMTIVVFHVRLIEILVHIAYRVCICR